MKSVQPRRQIWSRKKNRPAIWKADLRPAELAGFLRRKLEYIPLCLGLGGEKIVADQKSPFASILFFLWPRESQTIRLPFALPGCRRS